MSQSVRIVAALAALLAVVGLAGLAAAQEAKPAPKPGEAQPGAMPYGFYGLPGYYMLQTEQAQKELELVPEQIAQLKEIARKYYEQMREDQKVDWAAVREKSADEQKKFYQEMQQRYNQRTADVKKDVEKVLLAHQLKRLKDMDFRSRAAGYLYSPATLEKIGLDEKQKEKIQQVRQEIQAKMTQLQQESLEKTLGVLTPEQMEKLKELVDQGFSPYGRGGAVIQEVKEK